MTNYNKFSKKNVKNEETVSDVDVNEVLKIEDKTGTIINCQFLRLRNNPSPDAEVVTLLEVGTNVKISDDSNDLFYKVSIENDVTGYVLKEFIIINE